MGGQKIKKTERPAVFIDRDGVLNRDLGYVHNPEDLELLPGVLEGLKLLKSLGFWLIVVTNQSGVARGYFTEADVARFHTALATELAKDAITLDGIYVCPHHSRGSVPAYAISCTCRKPEIGLIEQASRDFPIDFSKSYFIGDKPSDVECGKNAKLHTIQVMNQDSSYGTAAQADFYAENLLAAAQWIAKTIE